MERVVEAAMDPRALHRDLYESVKPVADRVTRRYRAAQASLEAARAKDDAQGQKEAKAEMDALVLFKSDMGAFLRLYTFLSQIFDYGSAAIEKRAIFYRLLLPHLELGRERETIDLSKIKLTHHTLRSRGKAAMVLGDGDTPKLDPLTEAGAGSVQERHKARLDEIIERVNSLFDGELTDQDKLVYVNDVIKGKLLESDTLVQQAANNTKEQFASSPDLQKGILDAVMTALDAHTLMSTQALNSDDVRQGIKDILLNHARLWEALREKART
ncbi:MAG: hypothetical protein R3B70_21265 [Polyangiaceae bacterium]